MVGYLPRFAPVMRYIVFGAIARRDAFWYSFFYGNIINERLEQLSQELWIQFSLRCKQDTFMLYLDFQHWNLVLCMQRAHDAALQYQYQ